MICTSLFVCLNMRWNAFWRSILTFINFFLRSTYLETKENKQVEHSEFLSGQDNDIEFLEHFMNILLKNLKKKQKNI